MEKKEIKQNEKKRKETREGPNTFKNKVFTYLPIYKLWVSYELG